MNLKSVDALIKQYILKDLSKYGVVDVSLETTNLIAYLFINSLQAVYKDIESYRSSDSLINYRVKSVIDDNNVTLFYVAEAVCYTDKNNNKNAMKRYLIILNSIPMQATMIEILTYLLQLERKGNYLKTFNCMGCGHKINWLDIPGSLLTKIDYAANHYCGC